MRPISAQVKHAIVAEHFSGKNRDPIAKKLHKSGSTVSREIEKFAKQVESKGLQRAAEEYGVSQLVNDLHELSVTLLKNKVSATDALAGAAVASKLRLLQIDPDDIESFIMNVHRRATDKGYSPSAIIDDCLALQNLESSHNRTFEEIEKEFEEMGSKVGELREEASNLKEEIDRARKENVELWNKNNIDRKDVEQFKNTRIALIPLGLNIEDLDKTKNMLITIKKEGHNPRRIISKIRTIEDLEARKSKLDEDVKQAKEGLDSLNRENGKTEAQLKAKRKFLDEAEKLEDTHLSIEDIQAVRNTVVKVATNNGLTSQQALKRLQKDIIENYDQILGLEPMLNSLTRRKEKLEDKIKEQKQELEETRSETEAKVADLDAEYAAKKEQISAYLNLRRKGITDEDLQRWSSIISTTKLNPTIIEAELKTQRNLKHTVDETKKSIIALAKREAELKESITQLESRQNSIEKSIELVQQTGINRIKATATAAAKQTEEVLNTVNIVITEASQQLQTNLGESNQKILDVIDASKKGVDITAQNLNNFSEQVQSLTDQAIVAGEKIGALHPMAEAYQFIDKGTGNPEVVIPLSVKFLSNLKPWLKQNAKSTYSLEITIDSLVRSLRES